MGASIRFFAVVGPYRDDDPAWWPNVSHAYLRGLLDARLAVRAITISGGGAYLDLAGDPEWEPWMDLAPMFSTPMDGLRVNIVCAPSNMALGRRVVSRDGGGYTPATALRALWTANVYNVAITCGVRREDDAELEALRRYDMLVPPNVSAEAQLLGLGLVATRRTPQAFAADIESASSPVSNYG